MNVDVRFFQEIYENFTNLYNAIAGIKHIAENNQVYFEENTVVFPGKYKDFSVAITPTEYKNRFIFSFKIAAPSFSQAWDACNKPNYFGETYTREDVDVTEQEALREGAKGFINMLFDRFRRDNIFVTPSAPHYLVWQVDAKLNDSSTHTISSAMLEEFRFAIPFLAGESEIEDDFVGDSYCPYSVNPVHVGYWERRSADLRNHLEWVNELDKTAQESLEMIIRKSSSLTPMLQCTILELMTAIPAVKGNSWLSQDDINDSIKQCLNKLIKITEFYLEDTQRKAPLENKSQTDARYKEQHPKKTPTNAKQEKYQQVERSRVQSENELSVTADAGGGHAMEETSIKRRFCFNCGTKLVEGANFCYHCGLNLKNPCTHDFISSKSVADAQFVIQEKFMNDDDEIVVRGIVPDKLEIRRNDVMALKKCDGGKFYVDIVRIEICGKEYAQAKVGQYVDIVLSPSERDGELTELTENFIDYEDVLIHNLVQVVEINKEDERVKVVTPGSECWSVVFGAEDTLCVMKETGRVDAKTYDVEEVSWLECESLPDIYQGSWGTTFEIILSDTEGLHEGDFLCLVNEHYTVKQDLPEVTARDFQHTKTIDTQHDEKQPRTANEEKYRKALEHLRRAEPGCAVSIMISMSDSKEKNDLKQQITAYQTQRVKQQEEERRRKWR